MKLIMESRDLGDAVAWAARVLARTPANPVLAGLRVTAHAGGRVEVDGHDYDLTARGTTSAEVGEPGSCLLPGWLVNKVLASLPSAPLELVTSATEAVLSCGAATCTFQVLPDRDFPSLPVTRVPLARAHAGDLRQLMQAVSMVVSDADSVPPRLQGSRLMVEGNTLTLTGSDGFALATGMMDVERPSGSPPGRVEFTIPMKSLLAFVHGMTTGDPWIDLAIDSRESETGEPAPGILGWSNPVRSGTTRGLDTPYADWEMLFRPEAVASATVEVAPLIAAMKLAAAMGKTGDPAIQLTFSEGQVRVEGGLDEDSVGRTQDVLPAEYSGPGEKAAVIRSDYLAAVLEGAGSPVAVISFTGKAPLIVTPGGDGGTPGYRASVAPRRLVHPK